MFDEQARSDTKWAIGSISFVFLYFILHLQSVFLASYCVLLIILSFPLTQLIYCGLFGISYFSTLHIMVIFIVLGISADDIFVIIDAWKQSEFILEFEGNLRRRVSYSFKRSAIAIAVASSTTCVAFLANGFSSIMPIQAFGIYAGIIVPVNYLLTSLLLPPMLYIHDRYLRGRCVNSNAYPEESCIEGFFENIWNSSVRFLRYILVFLFLGWTGYACYIAKDISPLTENE